MKQLDRRLRIIGGNWRGRKVSFPDSDDLRPTSDRVRETLFNWLMHDIHGARVLDLFAGSGILGIEALSRGAAHVTFVDSARVAVESLEQTLSELGADRNSFSIACVEAMSFLSTCRDSFDVIFLDPPYESRSITKLADLIARRSIAGQWVYLETAEEVSASDLPADFSIHRQKRAGMVHYCLCSTPSV